MKVSFKSAMVLALYFFIVAAVAVSATAADKADYVFKNGLYPDVRPGDAPSGTSRELDRRYVAEGPNLHQKPLDRVKMHNPNPNGFNFRARR